MVDVNPGGTTDGAGDDKKLGEQTLVSPDVTDVTDILPAAASFYWKMLPPKKGSGGGKVGREGGFGPAPRLSPVSETSDPAAGQHISDNSPGPSTHINIRDTHHWTESPTSSRREVPMLNLKEYKILTNPMVNQLMNNVGVAVQAGGALFEMPDDLKKRLKKLQTSADGIISDQKPKPGSPDFALGAATMEALEGIESGYANPLNPYKMLYTVSPTKFKYTFPYMEDAYIQKAGSFGQAVDSNVATSITQIAAKLMSTPQAILAPGRMIEEPKAFSFTGREKSYTVTFPLFNTKDYIEIIKNWQFIYLLTYQNTPNRITRDLIDPPCIYEAKIPGVWYSKYASITNMQVDFIGARREMDMPIQYLDSANDPITGGNESTSRWRLQKRKIKTVIPDAYMVTITLTELFSETQNFLYHMVAESMDGKVSVTSK